jgi:hypothetical protein
MRDVCFAKLLFCTRSNANTAFLKNRSQFQPSLLRTKCANILVIASTTTFPDIIVVCFDVLCIAILKYNTGMRNAKILEH